MRVLLLVLCSILLAAAGCLALDVTEMVVTTAVENRAPRDAGDRLTDQDGRRFCFALKGE